MTVYFYVVAFKDGTLERFQDESPGWIPALLPIGCGLKGYAGGGDCVLKFGFAVDDAQECGFELRGGQPDALFEHGAVETAVCGGV